MSAPLSLKCSKLRSFQDGLARGIMGLSRPWISVSDTEHQINPIKGDDSRKLSEWVSLCKIKRGGQTLQGGWWAATVVAQGLWQEVASEGWKVVFFSVALHSLDYHTHAVHTHRQSQYIKFDFFQKVSVTLWCVTV